MMRTSLIAATVTPLTPEEGLHAKGLERHLDECWHGGMTGVLVAGTMGCMQLLSDETYRSLVERSVSVSKSRGEVFVGAGDASFARTRERIAFLNRCRLDGIVVLPPYFFTFNQEELIEYYRALADYAKSPLYLYDLPGRTRTKLNLETVLKLSEHPNIAGIKTSEDPSYARQLRDRLDPAFRVILAAPDLIDTFLRSGFREHLDGMLALAPRWAAAIANHAKRDEWEQAANWQQKLTRLKAVLLKYGVLPACSAILNAAGIPGSCAPRPFGALSSGVQKKVLAEPIVEELLATENRE